MEQNCFLGADIGGSHITAALVNANTATLLENSVVRETINSKGKIEDIINGWFTAIKKTLKTHNVTLKGIGFAMPGPFDYKNGISKIHGVNKYDALYGINIKQLVINAFSNKNTLPVYFENDAFCFGLGVSHIGHAAKYNRLMVLTLGTGFGAAFIEKGQILTKGKGVPPEGYLYNTPFGEGIAEEYISTAWLIKTFEKRSGEKLKDVRTMHRLAVEEQHAVAIELLQEFGRNLATCIVPWIKSFQPDCIVIGGNITNTQNEFIPSFREILEQQNITIPYFIENATEQQTIAGAAIVVQQGIEKEKNSIAFEFRKTKQPVLPLTISHLQLEPGDYNIYPTIPLGEKKIYNGYNTLAQWICMHKLILVDGFVGNHWSFIRNSLNKELRLQNKKVIWIEMSAFIKDDAAIAELIKPFIGEYGTVWGKRATCKLEDFYDMQRLLNLQIPTGFDLVILIGEGSALCNWEAPIIYIDLPKNEIQYRMRAGSICNLGATHTDTEEEMYKRFYFVDWIVLLNHKIKIANKINVIADGQQLKSINWALKKYIQEGIRHIVKNVFRPRPWFAPGVWGGNWMKEKIKGLNKDEINYAWSFELIAPENGIIFESSQFLLEVAFDWLMLFEYEAILGKDAKKFGLEFPIRFDFLDTFDGGNLSIQCHPRLSYIQEHFGENITQDETYYILDCKEASHVYLGFQEGINKDEFKAALYNSQQNATPVQIEKYVTSFPSHKHDLFLIPNGTIHSSGKNNLVLEISATPYIFTFKMYDWLRMDLDGKPRPINIEHAFNNLNFDRKGAKVVAELISNPSLVKQGNNYKLWHLPTHPDHFYDIHRIEFTDLVTIETNQQVHVLMLVEGECIIVETENGDKQIFNYAETFIIPAAAKSYSLINTKHKIAKVVKAFIK